MSHTMPFSNKVINLFPCLYSMGLNEKYPEAHFDHFVNMLDMNAAGDWTKELIEDHISMYIQFEGEEMYAELVKEIVLILKNSDLAEFADVFSHDLEKEVSVADLQALINQIKNYRK